MSRVFYHARLGWEYLRLVFLRQLEYPVYLISWTLIVPLQYLASVAALHVMARKFHIIAGWSFPELLLLYTLGAMSNACSVVLFLPVVQLETAVIQGDFERLLLRPANVLWQYCGQSFNILGLVELIPAGALFSYACVIGALPWSRPFLFQMGSIILGATLIRGAILLLIASVAFWTMRSRPLVLGGALLMDRTTSYPLSIYPPLVQMGLTFFMPIAFINYLPVAEMLGKPVAYAPISGIWLLTPLVGLATFAVAYGVFRTGLARTDSPGS